MSWTKFIYDLSGARGVAFDALGKLTSDIKSRVYASSECDNVLKSATKGLKQSRGHSCLNRLLNIHCDGTKCLLPDYIDHCSLWLKNGKPHLFVYQPYAVDNLGILSLAGLIMEYNFEVSILSDKSGIFHLDLYT